VNAPPRRRRRPLQRLKPDAQLYARKATGEPLRDIAKDYGVNASTLSRFFRRLG
jgi:hypothetical protein